MLTRYEKSATQDNPGFVGPETYSIWGIFFMKENINLQI